MCMCPALKTFPLKEYGWCSGYCHNAELGVKVIYSKAVAFNLMRKPWPRSIWALSRADRNQINNIFAIYGPLLSTQGIEVDTVLQLLKSIPPRDTVQVGDVGLDRGRVQTCGGCLSTSLLRIPEVAERLRHAQLEDALAGVGG